VDAPQCPLLERKADIPVPLAEALVLDVGLLLWPEAESSEAELQNEGKAAAPRSKPSGLPNLVPLDIIASGQP
jgi:hypothetical protein